MCASKRLQPLRRFTDTQGRMLPGPGALSEVMMVVFRLGPGASLGSARTVVRVAAPTCIVPKVRIEAVG